MLCVGRMNKCIKYDENVKILIFTCTFFNVLKKLKRQIVYYEYRMAYVYLVKIKFLRP